MRKVLIEFEIAGTTTDDELHNALCIAVHEAIHEVSVDMVLRMVQNIGLPPFRVVVESEDPNGQTP